MRPATARAWRVGAVAATVLGLVALAWLAYQLRYVLLPFALALILAYTVEPAVRALARRGLPRATATWVAFVALLLLAGVATATLLPRLLRELEAIGRFLPQLAEALQEALARLEQRYDRAPLPPAVREVVERGLRHASGRLADGTALLVDGLLQAATVLLAVLIAPFLAYYMLRDLDLFRRRFLELVPPRWRGATLALLADLDRVVGGFIRGQVLVAALIGAMVGGVAALLGMPFAVTLGLLAGLGEFIPYFGPVLGSLPAVAVAALQSPGTLIRLLLFLVVIHQLEQAVLTPRILGAGVGLHPLTVVFALLVGGELGGVFGMLVAVPAAGVLRVVCAHAVAEVSRWRREAEPVPGDGAAGGPPEEVLAAPDGRPAGDGGTRLPARP